MTGVIATIPLFQFSNALGIPLAGGKLYTYLAGTTTPEATYQDEALMTANTNPITLDSSGSCVIWLDPAKSYKFLLKSALGVTQPGWPVDNVSGAATLVSLTPTLSLYATLAALAASAGSALIGFIQSGAGAVAQTVQAFLRERYASITSYGAVDGQDSTTALQNALTAHPVVWVPPGKTYYINTVTIASDKRLIVDGTLKRIANAASDSYMITNASGAAGDSNIVIEGDGELDGNASNQTGDRQGLIKFQAPTDCRVTLRKAGNNKYASTNPTVSGQGCIVFTDAVRSHISVRLLYLWQREGMFIDGASSKCTITKSTAVGDGLNSWSAASISGASATDNQIIEVEADNCGASSIVLDSTNSEVSDCISRNNQFNNGFNFGHTGKPATGSRANNLIVINAGQGASSGTHCGVQVGGGTTDFDLSDVTVSGAYSHCIQVSDSASKVQIGGKNRLTGALHGSGVNVFAADQTRISGVTAYSNSDYGINFNASNDCSAVDCDLRSNTTNAFSSSGSRVISRGTVGSSDSTVGSTSVGGLGAGGSIVVNNGNVFAFSTAINAFCRDATAAAGLPFISTQTTGSFTITVTNAVAAGSHNVSWQII